MIVSIKFFRPKKASISDIIPDIKDNMAMAAIPAACACVECMMPTAQAGRARTDERRLVPPESPSRPAPVLGDAGRRSRVAKFPQTRPESVGPRGPAGGLRARHRPYWPASCVHAQQNSRACSLAVLRPCQGRQNSFHPVRNHKQMSGLSTPWKGLLHLARPLL